MTTAAQSLKAGNRIRLRPIALPVEHGGWSLLLEPIVLGLMLAPTYAGLLLSAGALALFLARHPYKLAARDWQTRRRGRRTIVAERFAFLYFIAGALSLALAVKMEGPGLLVPLAIAAPLTMVQLVLDARGQSRSLVAELAASIATGSLATSIALSGGWSPPLAFALWAAIAARSAPTILYLRARLRFARGKPAASITPVSAHVLALLTVILLASIGLLPRLTVLAIAILLVRAVAGLSKSAPRVTPQVLGIRELCFGLLTVLATAVGYYLRF